MRIAWCKTICVGVALLGATLGATGCSGGGSTDSAAPEDQRPAGSAAAPAGLEQAARGFAQDLARQNLAGIMALFSPEGLQSAGSLSDFAGLLASLEGPPTIDQMTTNEAGEQVLFLARTSAGQVRFATAWVLLNGRWRLNGVVVDRAQLAQ